MSQEIKIKQGGIFGNYDDSEEEELKDILSSLSKIVSELEIEIKNINKEEKIIQELTDKCTIWKVTRDKVVELEENGITISLDSDIAANIEKNYNTIYQLCTKRTGTEMWKNVSRKLEKKI